jgi:peptidoglycan hydrolase CwlO-like protein
MPQADRTTEVEALRLTLAEQSEHLDSLRARLDEMVKRQVELRELLLEAHRDLVGRDEAIERLQNEMVHEIRRREEEIERKDGEIDHRGRVIGELQAALDQAQETTAAMEATRVWRAGQRLWRARDRLRGK